MFNTNRVSMSLLRMRLLLPLQFPLRLQLRFPLRLPLQSPQQPRQPRESTSANSTTQTFLPGNSVPNDTPKGAKHHNALAHDSSSIPPTLSREQNINSDEWQTKLGGFHSSTIEHSSHRLVRGDFLGAEPALGSEFNLGTWCKVG